MTHVRTWEVLHGPVEVGILHSYSASDLTGVWSDLLQDLELVLESSTILVFGHL